MLAKLGVTVMRGVRVDKVDLAEAGTATTVVSAAILTLSNGQKLEADLYIPATGTKPNTSFISSSILTANGRVEVNPSTLRVDKAGPRIYAIGDASSFARPAVHNIFEAVPVVGNNLKGDILLEVTGSEGGPAVPPEKSYNPDNGETQLVPIGRRTGVGAFMGWKMPGWVIWMIKGRDYWLWSTPRLWSGKQWEKEK
jgi:NADPH-dependent 2,4-dienoyl-CoA reductase/sulfur reductase-like enzyme